MATRFSRGEIRKILGDAHTEEIENQLVALHLGVVDPLKDDLAKYKADAEKVTDIQKELEGYKNGKDWQKEYNDLKKSFDDFKADVAGKEALAVTDKAFRRALTKAKIPEKFHDRILKMTDLSAYEMEGEEFKDADAVGKQIDSEWGEYKTSTQTQGDKPETPPKDTPTPFDTMSLSDKMIYANEHPNDPSVRAWLNK